MKRKGVFRRCTWRQWFIFVMVFLLFITGAADAGIRHNKNNKQVKWWQVTPEEEVPSKFYDSILYSEIAPKLREIQKNSHKRIRVKIMGQSAGGRNLFLVTIAAPGEEGRFGHYKKLRKLMLRDPEKALRKIDQFEDFKVPVFINGSIHGDEYPGTDACIRLIEKLAYEDSPEVQAILDNVILLINVVQNPDGRVLGTRQNANKIDINRDFITQSQPETLATVKVIKDWNPMVFLDLHGFVSPMLIEPCTPPHNPNYEYDLYLKWALDLAHAMENELYEQTDETNVIIPYLDWPDGWDDWSPIYAAMYPMLHGAYGHTLETPHEDERGVDAHFAVVWGALNFVVENKKAMVKDQIEVYRRGALDLPQVLIPEYLLSHTDWEQYNEMTLKEFPEAYLIPARAPYQKNPGQTTEFIDFLIANGVEVEKAMRWFRANEGWYPPGTYVVRMDQPKRSLANTILEDGMDVSGIEGLTFYSPPAAWSLPLLWGISRDVLTEDLSVPTVPVSKARQPLSCFDFRWGRAFAVVPDTAQAFKALNDRLNEGRMFYRAGEPFTDRGRDFGAGTIVFPQDFWLAWQLKKEAGVTVYSLRNMPEVLTPMTPRKIAVYGEPGITVNLSHMGFDCDNISGDELADGGLSGYDVLVFGNDRWWAWSLNSAAIAAITGFINGGNDFIAMGGGGNSFTQAQGILGVTVESATGNGIVNIDIDTDHALGAGFETDEYAFVYDPCWYSSLAEGIEVAARYNSESLFVSGYWPGWETSTAAGMPAMVFSENPDNPDQDIVLMGFDPGFRAHPKQTVKLIGNAIFSGLDN
ncbi:MAG: hypothetical protein HUN04_22070 [Desulfobacter sp.]|nr:MAG: hypothetical protein HUN04_22070 [Desulfobacter sp.]